MADSDESADEVSTSEDLSNQPGTSLAPSNENQLSIGGIRNLSQMKHETLMECNRQPYLDGTYFTPNLENSKLDGSISAVCQLS